MSKPSIHAPLIAGIGEGVKYIIPFDYTLAAIVTAGLLFYLTYALLKPERF
jgi:K+-transporting ATPase KdpF subunit